MGQMFLRDYKVPVFVIEEGCCTVSQAKSFIINNGKKEASTSYNVENLWENRVTEALGGYIVINKYNDEKTIGLFLKSETIYKGPLTADEEGQVFDLYNVIDKINREAIPVFNDMRYIGAVVDIPEIDPIKNKTLTGVECNSMRIDITSKSPMTVSVSKLGKVLYKATMEHVYWYNLKKVIQACNVSQAILQICETEIPYIKTSKENIEVCGLDINTQTIRNIQNFPEHYLPVIIEAMPSCLLCNVRHLPLSGETINTLSAISGKEVLTVETTMCCSDVINTPKALLDGTLTLLELGEKQGVRVVRQRKSKTETIVDISE